MVFPGPVLWFAWAFASDGGSALGNILAKSGRVKAKTIALKLRDAVTSDAVTYLKGKGYKVIGWDVCYDGVGQIIADLGLDGFVPQIEGNEQYFACVDKISSGAVSKDLQKMLVTTYGGINLGDTADEIAERNKRVAKLKSLGLEDVFVECYAADGYPHNDLEQMLWQGTQYGFDASRLHPLVGTYAGELPSTYTGMSDYKDGEFGIYIGEPMSDAQLDAFAQFVPTPAPAPIVPSPAAINEQIAALCDSWLSTRPGPETSSRLRNISAIAKSYGKSGWSPGAQPAVTKALQDNGLL